MTSYLYEESNLNGPGISTFFGVEKHLLQPQAVEEFFDVDHILIESGCENIEPHAHSRFWFQPYPRFWFEMPLSVFAMLGFIVLTFVLYKTDRFLRFKYDKTNVTKMLLFTSFGSLPLMIYRWHTLPIFFWCVNCLLNFHYFVRWLILPSQCDYSKSKYAKRLKNKNKAKQRKARAAKAKEAKSVDKIKKESNPPMKPKSIPTMADMEEKLRKLEMTLDSQASYPDVINAVFDAPENMIDLFGHSWLKLRDMLKEFHLDFPSLPNLYDFSDWSWPDFPKYWTMFKESEVFNDFYHILRLAITLGFISKIDISFKGMTLLCSRPLREKVTIFEFIEAICSFTKLLVTKLYSVYTKGDIQEFFVTEAKNEYDNEYTKLMAQKVRVDLGREVTIEPETYDRRISECITKTLSLLTSCKAGERSYYSTRLAKLRDLETHRALMKKDGIREQAYGMLFYGKSGVGKSAISGAVTRYVLKTNGKDYSQKAVVSINAQDKFQSEYMPWHTGVVLDDMCNTKTKHATTLPNESVIMFINNMAMAALNPNAEMKGKVMIIPGVVTGTTNKKNLDSTEYSNEPISVNRRFRVTITQRVRKCYQTDDGTGMLDPDKIRHMKGQQFPDYGLFDVEYPVYGPKTTWDPVTGDIIDAEICYRPFSFEGEPLENVDIETLLRFLKWHSSEHFENQANYVATQRSLAEMPLCEHDMPVDCCSRCKAAATLADDLPSVAPSEISEITEENPLESQMYIPLFTEVCEYLLALEDRFMIWLNELISTLLTSQHGNAIIAYLMRDVLKEIVMNSVFYYLLTLFFILLNELQGMKYNFLLAIILTVIYVGYLYVRFIDIRKTKIVEFTNIQKPSDYLRSLSLRTKMRFVYFLISIGAWKVLKYLAQKWKTLPKGQSAEPIALKPDMKAYQKQTEFWDEHARERQYQFGNAGVSEKSSTTTVDRVIPIITRGLFKAEKEDGTHCNALCICSNVAIVPWHFVPKKTQYLKLTSIKGHVKKDLPFDTRIVQKIAGQDFGIWYCPALGDQKDIRDYYPKDILEGKKLDTFTVFNSGSGLSRFGKMTATRGRCITSAGGTFSGLNYSFPEDTFGGLCMAVIIGNAQGKPFIAGHHLAGRGTTGAAGCLTRDMINTAIESLDTRPGVLVSHSTGDIVTESMGINYGPLNKPHDKCVTNGLPNDAKINIFGAHNQPRSDPKSNVVTSLISSSVEEVMDIPKQHGPPKNLGDRMHKVKDMYRKVDTASRFDTECFQKACIDLSARLDDIPKSELKKLGKISLDANLAGLDGVLGINAMNFSTSVGFPGKGPKTQVVEKSDRVVPGIDCPRDISPEILAEVEALKQKLLKGENIHTVFKGSMKDEPTKLTKDKARVFAAANLPMILLVREYYLSIAALYQRNKETTECAVGVVVQSPEWTKLYEHIGKFGKDRAVAGDYAGFDGQMSAQCMLAAFKQLITLAEKSGNYDEDDLTIMRGIASEISYPTYDYFGTIVQFLGSNPSGHPMTVVINSIVNSIYMRYVYYVIARDQGWWKIPLFHLVVALMTYGDDNIMTVRKGYDAFNHTAIQAELAKIGIEYTMPDKTSKSVPFVNLLDCSFLKHTAVWDDELSLYRSPVESASIAKMLHTHHRSKVLSMEQSSAEAIQNVALKYFECGREVYTERVSQLTDVARNAGIQGYVGPIMTYDERIQWYKEKFEL